jgi:hypothetical protein
MTIYTKKLTDPDRAPGSLIFVEMAADEWTLGRLRQGVRTVAWFVLAITLSAAFGVIERILQDGSAAGWYLANVAGVWLALAFVFGALVSARSQAWLIGLIAEMSALGGFYGYMRFGEYHHEPLNVIAFWTCCGLIAGPLFGLVGYAWRRQRSQFAGLILGTMFVSEAVLMSLARARPRSVTELESVAGVLLTVLLLAAVRWRKNHPHEQSVTDTTRPAAGAPRRSAVAP